MSNTPPPPPPSGTPQGQPAPQGNYPQGNYPQQYGTSWQDAQPGQQAWGPGHPPAPPVPPQPEKKRSWFRRHKIMTALLAIVAFIVFANLVGGGEDETPEAADKPAAAAEQPAADKGAEAKPADKDEPEEPADTSADEPAEETTADEPAEEAAPEVPGLNDPVRDGKFEFVVTEVETGLPTIGEGFTEEQAQGQFVLIHVKVTNIGDQGTTMFDGDQVLIDEQGRQHNTSSASIWLDDGLWLDEINPGNSMEGVLLYDIPADAVPTSLELHDSMFSGGVTVSLQ